MRVVNSKDEAEYDTPSRMRATEEREFLEGSLCHARDEDGFQPP